MRPESYTGSVPLVRSGPEWSASDELGEPRRTGQFGEKGRSARAAAQSAAAAPGDPAAANTTRRSGRKRKLPKELRDSFVTELDELDEREGDESLEPARARGAPVRANELVPQTQLELTFPP